MSAEPKPNVSSAFSATDAGAQVARAGVSLAAVGAGRGAWGPDGNTQRGAGATGADAAAADAGRSVRCATPKTTPTAPLAISSTPTAAPRSYKRFKGISIWRRTLARPRLRSVSRNSARCSVRQIGTGLKIPQPNSPEDMERGLSDKTRIVRPISMHLTSWVRHDTTANTTLHDSSHDDRCCTTGV